MKLLKQKNILPTFPTDKDGFLSIKDNEVTAITIEDINNRFKPSTPQGFEIKIVNNQLCVSSGNCLVDILSLCSSSTKQYNERIEWQVIQHNNLLYTDLKTNKLYIFELTYSKNCYNINEYYDSKNNQLTIGGKDYSEGNSTYLYFTRIENNHTKKTRDLLMISSDPRKPIVKNDVSLIESYPIGLFSTENKDYILTSQTKKQVILTDDLTIKIDNKKGLNNIYLEYDLDTEFITLYIHNHTEPLILKPKHLYKIIGSYTKINDSFNLINLSKFSADSKSDFILAENNSPMGYKITLDGWKQCWGYGENPTFPITFEDKPYIISGNNVSEVTKNGMKSSIGHWFVEGF